MEYVKLGDVCLLKSGKSVSKELELKSGDVPYVKVSDMSIKGNERYIVASSRYIDIESSSKEIFPIGTVIFPKRGGAIGTNKKRLTRCEICADLNVMGVIPTKIITSEYLFAYFSSLDLGELSNGSSVPQINNSDIAPLMIPLPSKNIQIKISQVLDKAQELIDKRKEQIAACDELIKSLFNHMFGDPIINPQKWKMVKLSELANIKIGPFGTLLHKEEYISDGHALVNPSHIINGKICCDMNLTISEEKYSKLKAYHLKKGDVILGRRGEMGRCAVVEQEGLLCGTGSLFIRSKGQVNSDILQKIISFPSYKKTIEDKAVGQTMPNLNVPIVSSFMIPKIPMDAQEQYFRAVQQVEKLKSQMQQSLTELETNFNALMQRAFNGELF